MSAQTTEWVYHKTEDGAHPDGQEQQMVWLMNRARANPAQEGVFLASSGNADTASAASFFNINIPLMLSEFSALPAAPPAAFDRRLYLASFTHSLDLIARDAQDHTNQFARVTSAGFDFNTGRVSVFAYSRSALYAHGALNIDWGDERDGMQAERGHRGAIMSGSYTNVGVALVPETTSAKVGPLVFSGAYCGADTSAANHFNRFIVGTVWTDANANARYDPGEGVNGVRVQPGTGPWHAITGMAGGFAFPAAPNTLYNLTFSGNTQATPITRTASVATTSVLVDVKTGARPLALTITLEGGKVVLEWSGGMPPYEVQTALTLGSPWTPLGKPTSSTRLVVIPTTPEAIYRVVGGPEQDPVAADKSAR